MEPQNEFNPDSFPKTKEAYEAPTIEILEVLVEQGVQMYPTVPGGSPDGTPPSF